jgi:hypothetical protein
MRGAISPNIFIEDTRDGEQYDEPPVGVALG